MPRSNGKMTKDMCPRW